MKGYFVTGIDTEIGKTVISAILCEALEADYWKPVQSGDAHNSDTMKVRSLVENTKSVFHKEQFVLGEPMSPHASAEIDGIQIKASDFKLPETNNTLIIEGAGGLMVPLNDNYLMIDLIQELGLPVILVSKNYLGSINHSLLSIEALQSRSIPIKGIIFNNSPYPSSESFIEAYSKIPILARIGFGEEVSSAMVKKHASSIRNKII